MAKAGATPLGQRSSGAKAGGNSKSTPLAKASAKATAKAKAHETSLAKPPSPKTPGRTQGSMAIPAVDIGLGRTRRKRGGTHMERAGSSGFISSSVMTMFMCGPFVQQHWL